MTGGLAAARTAGHHRRAWKCHGRGRRRLPRWWEGATLYQIYVRSWLDTNGDGYGYLPGATAGLDYLAWLGVDGIWLSPTMPSPDHDWGYDVCDYRGVHPELGTLEDLDTLIAKAARHGIKVLPDLNWWELAVHEAFRDIVRFWFACGVAGFRIDAALRFPVPGHRPVRRLGGSLADHDLAGDELLAAPAGARPGNAKRPAGPQARGQLTLQRPAALDIQGLVDRLVRDLHGLIIGEVGPQPAGDLLWAPRRRPPPVRPAPVTPPDPPHLRARHCYAIWTGDRAGEPVLHVGPQYVVRGEFAIFGPLARRSACHCAVVARYSSAPPRVAAFRRSSREIVDGDRPFGSDLAI
jgi:hypothetical protein